MLGSVSKPLKIDENNKVLGSRRFFIYIILIDILYQSMHVVLPWNSKICFRISIKSRNVLLLVVVYSIMQQWRYKIGADSKRFEHLLTSLNFEHFASEYLENT